MKTAREIIAGHYPGDTKRDCLIGSDFILAALAAEGFSIVETGRDPVTIEACAKVADEYVWDEHALAQSTDIGRACHFQSLEIANAIRALSRSKREGKTE